MVSTLSLACWARRWVAAPPHGAVQHRVGLGCRRLWATMREYIWLLVRTGRDGRGQPCQHCLLIIRLLHIRLLHTRKVISEYAYLRYSI